MTFGLIAYNQEAYIEEAIRGALAQTYSPLEIIISDDCSTDRTFDLMQRAVVGYTGPHHLTLRRNPENLGLIEHVNRLFELARGTWIVVAAGDDVSLPERTTELMRQADHYADVFGMDSGFIEIAADGMPAGGQSSAQPAGDEVLESLSVSEGQPVLLGTRRVLGATSAWHRNVYHVFGKLPRHTAYEDVMLSLRARALGRVALCRSRALVKYRNVGVAGSMLSLRGRQLENWYTKFFRRMAEAAQAALQEIGAHVGVIPIHPEVEERLRNEIDLFRVLSRWWDQPASSRRALLRHRTNPSWDQWTTQWTAARLLPKRVFLTADALRRIAGTIKRKLIPLRWR